MQAAMRLLLLALGTTQSSAIVLREIGLSSRHFEGPATADNLSDDQVSTKVQKWIKTKLQWLPLEKLKPQLGSDPHETTAIVTHAGKNHQEYIDMSIMLGRALEKYLPDVPRIAMVIAGMKLEFQVLLRQAGWKVLKVDDVDPCSDGIQHCDEHFQYRWKDSFEKLNIFRLPFARVLFLDADTFVFNDGVGFLLNSTIVPDGYIGLPPDGCKTNLKTGGQEYNSGVMLFKPSLETFEAMLRLVSTRSGDDMLDQNIINEAFRDRVVPLDKKYDCIDFIGVPPGMKKACKKHHFCTKSEVVISHFTGMFKPTKANPFYLRLVQRPEKARETCENTNHGGCQKWAEYYCALHANRKHLTTELQEAIAIAGGCCMGKGHDSPECAAITRFNAETDSCPHAIDFGSHDPSRTWMSLYNISDKQPTDFNDNRPIYRSVDKELGMYLFYLKSKGNWVIGPSPEVDLAVTYAHADALCPHDANHWKLLNGENIWQAVPSLHLQPAKGSCPDRLRVMEGEAWPTDLNRTIIGTYQQSGIVPQSMHGGKPIFMQAAPAPGREHMYMYFLEAKTQWVIGPNYKEYNSGFAYVRGDAYCPKETLKWEIAYSKGDSPVQAQLLILKTEKH